MGKIIDLTGQRFGMLTVEELMPERQERYALYRCTCACGSTVYVNSKKLRRGTVSGCANCTQPRQHQPTVKTGDTFGDLTVVQRIDEGNGHGKGCRWLCRCICGEEIQATTAQLRNNRNTCQKSHKESAFYVNLAGRQIHQLTVLEKLDKRDKKGSVIWKCRCSCGRECEYSADTLLHGNTVSCGCYRRSFMNGETLMSGLHHYEGTCVEFLQRKKRSDNKTGYTGVYHLSNGRWKAGITFKGKRYDLGTYEEMADAVRARQRGEEMHDDFLEQYYRDHPEVKRKRIKSVVWTSLSAGSPKSKLHSPKSTECAPEAGRDIAYGHGECDEQN